MRWLCPAALGPHRDPASAAEHGAAWRLVEPQKSKEAACFAHMQHLGFSIFRPKGARGFVWRDLLHNTGLEPSTRQFLSHVPGVFELGHVHLIRAEPCSKELGLE